MVTKSFFSCFLQHISEILEIGHF